MTENSGNGFVAQHSGTAESGSVDKGHDSHGREHRGRESGGREAGRGSRGRESGGSGYAAQLRQRIDGLPIREAETLGRRIRKTAGLRDKSARREALVEIERAVGAAEERLALRREAVPVVHYPQELPVSARVDDLKAAIAEHQVVIVAGETGSGKSTQLPKICLDLGRGVRGLIGHTQPRRIAARALAERIADETGTELGDAVGYTIRFGDHTGPKTLVKLMTDGILLAEISRDRMLSRYDTIIIDEAHERSLNIDFLLGYLARLLPRRPDLKIVITSATIDPQRFSAHFGGAPIVEVSGRTYPVEVRYRPWGAAVVGSDDPDDEDEAGRSGEIDQGQAICAAVDELSTAPGDGDILVFLSGEREIRDTAEVLKGHLAGRRRGYEVIPLFGRLSSAEQHRVFESHTGRRIVLATNVAETSLTVPGIRYVIDPGTARISRYSLRTKVQRLPIEPISQASAGQRAGRCGRVANGICIRLYSEDDFAARPAFTDPEILRTSLASVILQMASLDLGDIGTFPFLDPPDQRQIGDGLTLLAELGALRAGSTAEQVALTPVGRTMSALPIDPQFARMIVAANELGCIQDVLVITAGLAIQDVRERPVEDREKATAGHARFNDPRSDFLSLLKLWNYLQEEGRNRSGNAFRRMCRTEYLHYLRVREWQDLVGQLRQIARSTGLTVEKENADSEARDIDATRIHQALLSGLLAHIGSWDEVKRDFQGTRGARFSIWPGSVLAKRQPKLVMAAELVETSRLWARMVASIEPGWAEQVGAHLVKRSYSEPRWESKRGSAAATEKVTLLGVTLVAARSVSYASIDPELSRELFIRHALVEGDWRTRHPFFRHNQELLERIAEREDRARRRDIAVDDETLFGLYDGRVPAQALSATHFDAWFRRASPDEKARLTFTEADLVAAGAADVDADAFPDRISSAGVDLDLKYVFDPTRADDGVTVTIPLTVLQRVAPEHFAAQVPGLRTELAIGLIRSLPKTLRRAFVPVPDFAAAALERIAADGLTGGLPDQLAAALTALTGVVVHPGDFDTSRIPAHLRMTFEVVDAGGTPVAAGKDLAAMQEQLRGDTRRAVAKASGSVERTGLTTFPPEPIPRTVDSTVDGFAVRGYPALVDEGTTVGVRVFATEADQLRAARSGTRRLLQLTLRSPEGYVRHALPRPVLMRLAVSGRHAGFSELVADAAFAAIDALLDWAGGPGWDAAAFTAVRNRMSPHLDASTLDVVVAASDVLTAAQRVESTLSELRGGLLAASIIDAKTQLATLLPERFISATGSAHLTDLKRYLEALDRRLVRLPTDPERDRARMAEVLPWEERFRAAVAALPVERRGDPDVGEVRRLLAEWRISLFAQPMKTTMPVSAPRVEKAIAALG